MFAFLERVVIVIDRIRSLNISSPLIYEQNWTLPYRGRQKLFRHLLFGLLLVLSLGILQWPAGHFEQAFQRVFQDELSGVEPRPVL